MSTVIYWHRDDLRLHDNPALARALETGERVLPVFVFDPEQYRMLKLGFRKTGYKRFAYLVQCVNNLRKSYRSAGGNLLIRTGNPATVLEDLVREYSATAIVAQREIASEEVTSELRVAKLAISDRKGANNVAISDKIAPARLDLVWGKTLYHRDDLPFGQEKIPATSKTFRIRAQKEAGVRDLIPTPERVRVPEVTDWGQVPQPTEVGFRPEEVFDYEPPLAAGETAALERLEYYTFGSGLVEKYKWSRNKSLGVDFSSKFSAWLNRGCLSPRQVYHEVKRYEREVKRNISTWWLVFEVVWRDYFIFSHWKHGNAIFGPGGYKQRDVSWQRDRALFDRWREGRTGIPFADAHLREMKRTGFMSNRGRVNTASFLTRDYEIDWRWGAAWFESQLLDYEVSVNWLNWNTQATEIYYTNPVHQSMKYDRKGEYILSQLPELSALPDPLFHAPWLAGEYDLEAVADYPDPAFIQKKWGRSIGNIRKAYPQAG